MTLLAQVEAGQAPRDDYQWDAPMCLNALVALVKDELGGPLPAAPELIRRRFFDWIVRIGRDGLPGVQAPLETDKGDALRWVGDKKPVQYADPALRPFLKRCFPDTVFVHIVRHPADAVRSMMQAADRWPPNLVPAFWRGSPQSILERWAIHEHWVLQAESEGWPVITLRYEDLCRDPGSEMARLWDSLAVDACEAELPPDAVRRSGPRNSPLSLAYGKLEQAVMLRYGYTDS